MISEKQKLEKEIEELVSELEFATRVMQMENVKILRLKKRIALLRGDKPCL